MAELVVHADGSEERFTSADAAADFLVALRWRYAADGFRYDAGRSDGWSLTFRHPRRGFNRAEVSLGDEPAGEWQALADAFEAAMTRRGF